MLAWIDIQWLVPIVVLVVYGLSAILKAKEQANPQAQQGTRRNPGQELDRFLQEIDRLRRQQENRGPAAQRQSKDEDDEEPTAQMPVVVVREQRPPPLLPRPVILRVQATPAQPPPPPVVKAPEPVVRTPQIVLPSIPPVVASRRTTGSNAAAMAMHLLGNRRSISAAFVLNEVLSPPKCKQRS
jgi:hypothetical protein